MAVIEIAKIQVRRGQENQTGLPNLAGGEFAWAADTEHLYIGLRREDGGSRDANVRILTENDLFAALGTTSTAYIYREGTAITSETGDILTEVTRSVQEVLDEAYVSVKHFGAEGDNLNQDSNAIQLAVDRLFVNDALALDPNPARKLIIPAGTYNITATVFLPPNTTIVGEGIDKTIINLTSTSTHAFQTKTLAGETFDDMIAIDSNDRPNNISISNLTIQYDDILTDVAQSLSLISLDCAVDTNIKRVKFKGNRVSGDTTAAGHSAIDMRGYNQVTTENVFVDGCVFENLYDAVTSNYDITKPTVENSYFYNLRRGINFNDPKDPTAVVGPRFGRFINNKFEYISEEAVYAGETNSTTATLHISMNNQYIDVGNNEFGELSTGTGTTAVLGFVSAGNSSVNDYFSRHEANQRSIGSPLTVDNAYHPLVYGRTIIDNSYVETAVLSTGTSTTIIRMPITGYPQNLSMKYSIFQPGTTATAESTATAAVDRMGTIELYIPPGNARVIEEDDLFVYDNYNFSGNLGINMSIEWSITLDDLYNYYEVSVSHGSIYDITIEYQTKLML
jgi:hypothetical protein